MSLPTFSVAIETANLSVADLDGLRVTLEALAAQTVPMTRAKEVLLTDSGDVPAEVLEELLRDFPWVRALRLPRGTGYEELKMAARRCGNRRRDRVRGWRLLLRARSGSKRCSSRSPTHRSPSWPARRASIPQDRTASRWRSPSAFRPRRRPAGTAPIAITSTTWRSGAAVLQSDPRSDAPSVLPDGRTARGDVAGRGTHDLARTAGARAARCSERVFAFRLAVSPLRA